MPTLKEMFSSTRSLAKLGAISFSNSVFRDEKKTPHWEMEQVLEMIETRPMINSGLTDYCRFVYGEELIFKSTDPKSKIFAEKWLQKRKNLRGEFFNTLKIGKGCGNGYLQRMYREADGQKYVDTYANLPDSSRVYINLKQEEAEQRSGDNYWIYRVHTALGNTIVLGGKVYEVTRWPIQYTYKGIIYDSYVNGIGLHRDELVRFKTGWSRDGLYGRGFLNSAIDDEEVIKEIIKNLATIARNRALNLKFIQVGGEDEFNMVDDKEIADLEEKFAGREPEEHMIINKPFKVTDFDSQGRYDSMINEMEFLRKDVQSGLLPSFLTPWGNDINMATAQQAKIPFALRLRYDKADFVDFLNNVVVKDLQEKYTWLSDDLEIDTLPIELDTTEEKQMVLSQMFRDNAISMNEYRTRLGFDKIAEGTKFAKDVADVVRFGADTTGAMKESLAPDVSDNVWRSRLRKAKQLSNKDIKNFKVLKKKNLREQIIRFVKHESMEKYHVFNGPKIIKSFELDERKAADSYYTVYIDNIEKSFDKYFEGETEEDKITDELFFDIKGIQADVLKELVKDVKSNKEAVLGKGIFSRLDGLFDGFNNRINSIVDNTVNKLMGLGISADGVRSDVGGDVEADEKTKQLMEDKADVLRFKIANKIKSFNQEKADEIKRIIANRMASGVSVGKINQELKDKFINFKKKEAPEDWKIFRIVRTEINQSSNLMKLLKWHNMGFEEFQWMTSGDEKVRPEHKRMNGRVLKIKDALEGKVPYPGHWSVNGKESAGQSINCRCFVTLYS